MSSKLLSLLGQTSQQLQQKIAAMLTTPLCEYTEITNEVKDIGLLHAFQAQ